MRAGASLAAFALALALATPIRAARGGDPIDAALGRYRAIAARGGWAPLPPGPPLEPGHCGPAVEALRARLSLTGDLAGGGAVPDALRYDEAVVAAVRSFQRRHGLRADGVVGAATRAAMNVPVGERIAQIGLARVQSPEPVPGGRWIRVNVPAFSLEVRDGPRVVLEMPVVVGRPSRPTPSFEKDVSAIVVNPAWTVPPDLAYEDVLPKIVAEPGYLARRRIDVYESWEPGAARLDPARIDWSRLGPRIQALTLRQRPGAGNALGRLMFRMEGERDIFLHDTPAREVFRQERRDLSSGCIRVADALGLARAILDPEGRGQLAAALARRDTLVVPLAHPVPIRITYATAWVDGHGVAHFRDDIYGEDAGALAASRGSVIRGLTASAR